MKIVTAVKNRKDIHRVERLLRLNGSDLCGDLWRIGINLALRISDLLSLRFEDVKGDSLTLKEGKTGKARVIIINASARKYIDKRRRRNPKDIYLFQSNAINIGGRIKSVNRDYVSKCFKAVGDEMKIKFNTHSMRKTRGYIMHKDKVPTSMIAKVLNHSSEAITLRYIGIEQEDIDKTYNKYCL